MRTPSSKRGKPDAIESDSREITNGSCPGCADTGGTNPRGPSEQNEQNGKQAIYRLGARVDGWIRIAPDGEAKTVFIKWKWVRGSFQNKYVMVHCHYTQLLWGFDLLEQKVEEVELGIRTPVEDRFYQQ